MEDVIELYTDGAASGNPGPGGYGIVLKYQKHRKEISAGFKRTTNNRMELLAVIVGVFVFPRVPIPVEKEEQAPVRTPAAQKKRKSRR